MDVLVDIVKPGHIWRTIADNELRSLTLKLPQYPVCGLQPRDIALELVDVLDRSHFLEIAGDDSDLVGEVEAFLDQLLSNDLGPGSRRAAEVDDPLGVREDLELLVDLEQLVGRSGAVAVFFGLSVVDVLRNE